MKKISKIGLVILIYLLTIVITINITTSFQTHISIIYDAIELKDELEANHPYQLFVDLRDRNDYEAGHISGFMNLPSKDGESVLTYLNEKKLKNKEIILMCYSGNRAAITTNYLVEHGIKNIKYVKFGFEEYAGNIEGFQAEEGQCDCLAE